MKKSIILIMSLLVLFPTIVQAQKGCCSRHGGVAGCSQEGRQICKDGTLSPSCTCTPSYIYGCTDSSAKNYNPSANKNDGTCIAYIKGCTDINSINYNSNAEKDDGSCIKKVLGCMDDNALNYNVLANTNNDSCQYSKDKNKDNSLEKNIPQNNSDGTSIGEVILGLGIVGSGVYFVARKKR